MRYDADHKTETRKRLLGAAAKQFRARGPDGVSVGDVMHAAGLTHGGFYRHFKDKNELLSKAMEVALRDVSDRIEKMTAGLSRSEALKTVIEFYLSEDHARHPELGCALAAVGSEIARMPQALKTEIGRALNAYAGRFDHLMPGASDVDRRRESLILFSSMAGCITSARAQSDVTRKREILSAGRKFFTRAFCGRAPISLSRSYR